MDEPICLNCCVEYPRSSTSLPCCPICQDERVITPLQQKWATMAAIGATHRSDIREHERGLTGIGVAPAIGIGQRAILVYCEDGCVLWDCTPLVDAGVRRLVESRGGLKAIAVSHPHFYGAMGTWSRVFGNVPIFVHENDRRWVPPGVAAVEFWGGDAREIGGCTLIRCGGHFEGASALYVPWAADGRGALLAGDTPMVLPNGLGIAMMRSYPRHVPLSLREVDEIDARLAPYAFDRMYGAWFPRLIAENGKARIREAVARYHGAAAA